MAELFDIMDEMPNTNCGKCFYGNCMEFAKALCLGSANTNDCSVLKDDATRSAIIKEMLD